MEDMLKKLGEGDVDKDIIDLLLAHEDNDPTSQYKHWELLTNAVQVALDWQALREFRIRNAKP